MKEIKTKSSFKSRLLGLLRKDRDSNLVFSYDSNKEENDTDSYNLGYCKEFKKAMLEAERGKAETIRELEKRRFIC